MNARMFQRRGHLALKPEAFFDLFFERSKPQNTTAGNVAIVTIDGPLTHHDEGWWDSYDAIKARVQEALEGPSRAIVLRISSPGGDASGCCETSREIRAMAAKAGKPVYAYADGMAASAAYALSCSASKIYTPATGFVGSIGVIKSMVSWAEANRAHGLDTRLVTSGARKSDGNPAIPISEEAIAASQAEVDDLARLFFELVAEARGMSTAAVQALQAGIFNGQRAIDAGLADGVSTFEGLLALAGEERGDAAKETKSMDLKELVAELKQKAEGEGEEADKAKKMLAALEGEPDGDEPKEESDKEEPKSEGEEPKKDEDEAPKKDEAKAMTPEAKRLDLLERSARKALLATRPDITGKTRAWLERAPLEVVQEAVESIEKPKPAKLAASLNPSVKPTTAEGAGNARADQLPKDEAHALDVAMGLAPAKAAVRREGTKLILGVVTPSQARAELARRQKEST